MNIVAPEQVITDDLALWMDHGHDTLEPEPFIALQVQNRGECTHECAWPNHLSESADCDDDRLRGDVSVRTAADSAVRRQKCACNNR